MKLRNKIQTLSTIRTKSFTLAEVLITLAIIGIVAALTIPTLLGKYAQEARITQLKKIYSELSQINERLNYEYGGNYLSECSLFNDNCFKNLFKPYLKIQKECASAAPNNCQEKSKYLNNATGYQSHYGVGGIDINANWPTLLLDNYSIKFRFHGPNGTSYGGTKLQNNGWVQIDVNGLQKPNTAGKDIFWLWLQNGHMSVIASKDPQYYTPQYTKNNCKSNAGITCAVYYLIDGKR